MNVIYENEWLELWNLFDIKKALNYTLNDKLYEIADLNGYLNDKYLVKAFIEIDRNIELLQEDAHFMYLYRLREEARLLYNDMTLIAEKNTNKIDPEYVYFRSMVKSQKVDAGLAEKLDKKYFVHLYNSIYFLHYNVEIELNELISRIPLKLKKDNEIISKEDNFKKSIVEYKEQVFHIYGGTNFVGNQINSITIPFDPDSEIKKKNEIEIIEEICTQFNNQIQYNGLHRLLYEKDKVTLKHENVSQRLFFSVAQIYCLANNLDISPETNSGSGSVDFKFSRGQEIKVNVEIKLSSSDKLIDGFSKQLDAYNKAEGTFKCFYVVIVVDNNEKINDLREISKKNDFPILKLIDGEYKKTASQL